MALTRRETAILAGGLVLGVAGAWALFARGDDAATPSQPPAARTAASTPAAEPARVASADLCSFDRVVAAAGEGDGQLRLEAELAGKDAGDVRDLLVTGKEAVAAGHPRDAETAFLMACRAAGKLTGDDAILLADAMYRLGTHYAAVSASASSAKKDEMRERARTLYATSLQAYRAKYGEDHERTRFASKGLATLGGSAGDAKMVAAAPETAKPAPAEKGAEEKKPSVAKAPVAKVEVPVSVAPKAPVVAVVPRPVPSPAPAPAIEEAPVARAPAVEPQRREPERRAMPEVAQRRSDPAPVARPRLERERDVEREREREREAVAEVRPSRATELREPPVRRRPERVERIEGEPAAATGDTTVAPSAPADASVGQATGDAGDTTQR